MGPAAWPRATLSRISRAESLASGAQIVGNFSIRAQVLLMDAHLWALPDRLCEQVEAGLIVGSDGQKRAPVRGASTH
jgi:hypothetical protein